MMRRGRLLLLAGFIGVLALIYAVRACPWWAPLDAFRIGDVYVRGDLKEPLSIAKARCAGVWAKCEREHRFKQGYGSEWASNGTHLHGWCLDIATGPTACWSGLTWRKYAALPDSDVRRLAGSLEAAGFAAPLRVVGYDLGYGRVVGEGDEHIHAVYHDHANFAACWKATRPGKQAWIERTVPRRR
jgi:hypothetical protein